MTISHEEKKKEKEKKEEKRFTEMMNVCFKLKTQKEGKKGRECVGKTSDVIF